MKHKGNGDEKHANHERWVISYADLLTLLLATFVVLYASSTRNKHKEDEIAEAFIKAFHGSPENVIVSPPTGSRGILPGDNKPISKKIAKSSSVNLPATVAAQVSREASDLLSLQMKLTSIFQPLIDQHAVSIKSEPLALTIQLDASVLFPSGEAQLKPDADNLLKQVAVGLTQLPKQFNVVVQGYTDNQPIATPEFSSNWSLSAERAVSVVELFESSGVNGNNLSAQGFGQFSPIGENETDAERALNRRVVVVVRASDSAE
jgi:chemotaxis protein MotB